MKIQVFKRSATSFEELATARKIKIEVVENVEKARKICHEFNDNRNQREIKKGTKYEFMNI